ncbi:unnamed protein product [Moneuplotes crassus]|uniref:Uncharacterized protein n=1 Tax=Euplotes crassus TaxID=5936 RepID=A0AAD2D479_EUPCR|nr:unnamed protein product [Moneuplotes crassus]
MELSLADLVEKLQSEDERHKKLVAKNEKFLTKEKELQAKLDEAQQDDPKDDQQYTTEINRLDQDIEILTKDIEDQSKIRARLQDQAIRLKKEINELEVRNRHIEEDELTLEHMNEDFKAKEEENSKNIYIISTILNYNKRAALNQNDVKKDLSETENSPELIELETKNKNLQKRHEMLQRQVDEMREFMLSHYDTEIINKFYEQEYKAD